MLESAFVQERQKLDLLLANLNSVIHGKAEAVDILVVALLAGGSVLMEDVPGVGKTTLAKALARSIDANFSRVQFTPDLLPADILGTSIYNPVRGEFEFRQGPIFCNILLADEINRASPRTQSALLEAMNEMQATIEGRSYRLEPPFMVLATENPVEYHGTYPLPEAQLDRFLVMLNLGYPDLDVEVGILRSRERGDPLDEVTAVLTQEEAVQMQQGVRETRVAPEISRYIVELAAVTRMDERIKLGVSPRGSLMLSRSAQAMAFLRGRDFVLPDDVQVMAPYVLAHRITLTPKARYMGIEKDDVIREIVSAQKIPT